MNSNMQTILILLLTSSILCQSNSTLNSSSNSTFNNLKNYYNNQQYDSIFGMLSKAEQEQNSQKKSAFITSLSNLYTKAGPITYDLYFGTKNDSLKQQSTQLVVFTKELLIGEVIWVVSNGVVIGIAFEAPDSNSSLDLFVNFKGKASLSIFFNNFETLGVNKDQEQIIASLVCIPIAIEFARQVNEGTIDSTTMVNISDIQKYYIDSFDGFPVFLQAVADEGLLVKNQISLQTIASGMTNYVSQALTEYLQALLGLSNIDSMTTKLGLTQTNSVYAASFTLAFTNYKGLSTKIYATSINKMTKKVLNKQSLSIHKILVAGKANAQRMLRNANQFLKTTAVANAINKFSVKGTSFQYATLFNNLNHSMVVSQAIVNLFYEILNPFKNYDAAEKQTFFSDDIMAVYSQGTINLVGNTQLNVPVGGVSKITLALFIQGLTADQLGLYLDQLALSKLFFSRSPDFCRDYVSRITQ